MGTRDISHCEHGTVPGTFPTTNMVRYKEHFPLRTRYGTRDISHYEHGTVPGTFRTTNMVRNQGHFPLRTRYGTRDISHYEYGTVPGAFPTTNTVRCQITSNYKSPFYPVPKLWLSSSGPTDARFLSDKTASSGTRQKGHCSTEDKDACVCTATATSLVTTGCVITHRAIFNIIFLHV